MTLKLTLRVPNTVPLELDGITPLADQLWRAYLENTGQSDNLYMLLRRAS